MKMKEIGWAGGGGGGGVRSACFWFKGFNSGTDQHQRDSFCLAEYEFMWKPFNKL